MDEFHRAGLYSVGDALSNFNYMYVIFLIAAQKGDYWQERPVCIWHI